MSAIRFVVRSYQIKQYYSAVRTLVSRPSNGNILSSGLDDVEIPPVTLQEYLYDKCAKFAKFKAIECSVTGRSYTYEDLRIKSRNLSKSLRKKINLEKGTVLALFLPNIPEYPIAALGGLEAGLIITTLNPVYTADEISRQLVDSSAKAIITIAELYDVAKRASSLSKKNLPIIVIKTQHNENVTDGAIKFEELIDNVVGIPDFEPGSCSDISFLPYSSGTTGLPKGVELTHANFVSNMCQVSTLQLRIIQETTENFQEIIPAVLPMFHIYGLAVNLANGLSMGSHIITLPKFSPELYVSTLENYKPTVLFAVPPMVLFLSLHPMVTTNHLKSVRLVMSGAAPLGASDEERLLEKAGKKIDMIQGYGLTEASPVVAMTTLQLKEKFNTKGSIGKPIPNTSVKVVSIDDPTGTPLGPDQPGELYVKGPQIMQRYHKRPEETAKTIVDGWLKTGDLVTYNKDGIMFVTDRLKELIKVRAFQVAPAELEEILRDYPDIQDAAVIGIPDEISGELPRAYIVPKQNKTVDIEKLNHFVSSKVAKYKQLKGGIEIVDSIPKNASGKILRRQLRLQYEEESR